MYYYTSTCYSNLNLTYTKLKSKERQRANTVQQENPEVPRPSTLDREKIKSRNISYENSELISFR